MIHRTGTLKPEIGASANMEHPWTLLVSIVGSSPLIWRTFRLFFPYLRDDLAEDGPWILFGFATWTTAKFLALTWISAAYVYVLYKLLILLLL